MMLRDTGCTQTLVYSSLVPKRAFIPNEKACVFLADGSRRMLPLAKCFLEVNAKLTEEKVGVVENLPEDVLLGNDIGNRPSALVATRAQTKKENEKEREVNEHMKRTKVRSKPLLETNEEDVLTNIFSENTNDINQKTDLLDITPATLRDLQKEDDTLKGVFNKVESDPLPKSNCGNRYILVLVDYATRYPEAVALPTIDTKTIADALVNIFSRVGLPDELLTDQGSNFTSELMQDVCKLLQIRKLRTSAYHPMANGLVERFNGTLKAMLRKYVTNSGNNWDSFIPYLLFAYREVPQASTGFSPFELLYGRKVRGPLDLVFESWTEQESQDDNVLQYVMDMRNRLNEMSELAKEHLNVEQKKQKTYYDKNSRERRLSPGDKVLVLLPSSTNKLHALWKGPYRITRRISDVDYEVRVGGNKGLQTYHINMLRQF